MNREDEASGGVDPRPAVLYDGQCSICAPAVRRLKRWDRHDRLRYVDITDASFDPEAWGLTMEEAMEAMHVVAPGGELRRGMEGIRAIGRTLGLGWLTAPTGWPGLRAVFDALYRWIARHRPRCPVDGSRKGDGCRVVSQD